MKHAIHIFRQEYLTTLGSSVKDLASKKLYDAISDSFKEQLKFNHLFGKAVASELQEYLESWETLQGPL